jgi:hypothetical protein
MKLSTSLLLGGLSLAAAMPTNTTNVTDCAAPPPPSTPKPKGKWFDRKLDERHAHEKVEYDTDNCVIGFVVIVFENTNKDVTFGNPYFLNLTNMGMTLGNYYGKYSLEISTNEFMSLTFYLGTTHPSQVNNMLLSGLHLDLKSPSNTELRSPTTSP